MATKKDKEVSIKVMVRKTEQESQYEPFTLELECSTTCLESERQSETLRLFNALEDQLYDILDERRNK